MRGKTRPEFLAHTTAFDRAGASGMAPVVIADVWDNPGGGVPGDSTILLAEMLRRRIQNAALATIWDPIAVRTCFSAGEGATFRLRFGAKMSEHAGDPIDADVVVKRAVCGAAQSFGQSVVPLGDAVWIEVGGVDVILNSVRSQVFNPDVFSNFGIDPTAKKLLVVKSTNHFQDAFARISHDILYAAVDGPYPNNPETNDYHNLTREIWPRVETPMADDINAIQTPAFAVNEAVALRNIGTFQAHCDAAGLALRPHIKTHKSIHFAKAQLAAGAIGITCQKISEAEAMRADGIDDILITYNILRSVKPGRLRALSDRLAALSVVTDNAVVVAGLSAAFDGAPRPLSVLVECDTGAGRCGVQSPGAAVALAETTASAPGLIFAGLMTYPPVGGAQAAATFLRATKGILAEKGIDCPVVSSGGSPDMWSATAEDIVTKYRIGTYIYNDRSLVERGTCTWDDCAGQVLATVVSTPVPGRAIIDAGSKVLTSDFLGFADYGHVVGRPDVRIVGLSEEHGTLEAAPGRPLVIGDRLRIVPNHVCVVSNMFDRIWIETGGTDIVCVPVDARGMVI